MEDIFHKSALPLWYFFKHHIVSFFEVSFERSPYFMRYLQDNSTMLIPKFQNKADYTS